MRKKVFQPLNLKKQLLSAPFQTTRRKENSYRLILKLNRKVDGDKSEPVKGSILIYNKKDSSAVSLTPGDVLIIRCTPIEIANRLNPYEFDYRFFMENQGIRYYAITKVMIY